MNIPSPSLSLFAVSFALAAAAALGGCATVVSKTPVGTKPAALDEEEWDGTWAFNGGVMNIQAIEPDDGVLELSWIEHDDKPELKTMPVYLREGNNWTYASCRDPDAEDGGDSNFTWGRIKMENGMIIVWAPDAAKFEALVKAEKLPGTVKDNSQNVVLEKLKPGHLEMIETEAEGVLFVWDDPLILRRIAND